MTVVNPATYQHSLVGGFPVAEYRGTFADYPLSGLDDFHGPSARTYLVRSLGE